MATQSISRLKDALPNEEGVKTLLQALRNKVFLTTTDPETARYASDLCGKADRTRISYTVSESSTNANVSWLSSSLIRQKPLEMDDVTLLLNKKSGLRNLKTGRWKRDLMKEWQRCLGHPATDVLPPQGEGIGAPISPSSVRVSVRKFAPQ